MTMIEMKIVPQIRERLAEMGRTPAWLSQQTGIDRASISRYMNGKLCHLDTALSISAALGVPIEKIWVFKEVEV